MTSLFEIKPYIRDFVEANLDDAFENKIYWLGERKNVPEYPYCLLNVIAENKDKRTSHHQVDTKIVNYSGSNNYHEFREIITTRYKTCTITVGIYNGWTEDTTEENIDMDEANEFAYEQIDFLEGSFEEFSINNLFSVQNISPIRPLHEVVDGGYMYRYEFDLTIGYNEPRITEKDYGQAVNAEIKESNQDAINFTVTVQNNDNIIVENNIRS